MKTPGNFWSAVHKVQERKVKSRRWIQLPTPLLDVFANFLLLFLMLAFSSFTESPERTLPPVTLTEAEVNQPGKTLVEPIILSAKQGGKERVRYFINDQEVAWAELPKKIQALAPSTVILRIDEELPTRETVRLLALLKNLNVNTITFAFKAQTP